MLKIDVLRKRLLGVFCVVILVFTSLPLYGISEPSVVYASSSCTQSNWFDANWIRRKRVLFNNSSSTENLSNFTVQVHLTSSNFNFDNAKSSGEDIRFTDSDGTTLLSYEIDKWDKAARDAILWVTVTQIDAASNTDFMYMYYNNPVASPGKTTNTDGVNRDTSGVIAAWPLDDTTTTQSYSRVINPSTSQGRDILIDGDMEAADTSAWTASNITLSKETGTPHGGSNVLRLTYDGTHSSGFGYQAISAAGKSYRITGYARGDGTGTPRIRDSSGTNIWTGTTSTSWQAFDETFTNTNVNIQFYAFGLGVGNYVEFDDVHVYQTNIPASTSFTGSELLTDGDMEASGTTSWNETNVTVSKVSGAPGGSGSQVLRVLRTGASPTANQSILTAGHTYRVTGWARGDGTNNPVVYGQAPTAAWTGTSSTSWQVIDGTWIASNAALGLYPGGTDGHYTEYDDVSVTEIDPLSGQPKNSITLGSDSSNGHLTNAYTFDGTNDYVDIYTTELNSAFNPDAGTLIAWAKVTDSSVWTDSTNRYPFTFTTDSSNYVEVRKTTVDNTFRFEYRAGGTSKAVSDNTTLAGYTGWFQVVITWDTSADEVKAYINGSQVGSTQTGLGTWSGNLSSSLVTIGSYGTGPTLLWSGDINDVRLYGTALSPSQIAAMYSSHTNTFDSYLVEDGYIAECPPKGGGSTSGGGTTTVAPTPTPIPTTVFTPTLEVVPTPVPEENVVPTTTPTPLPTPTPSPAPIIPEGPSFIQRVGDGISSVTSGIGKGISSIGREIGSGISNIASGVGSGISNVFNGTVNGVNYITSNINTGYTFIYQSGRHTTGNIISGTGDAIATVFTGAVTGTGNVASGVGSGVSNIASGIGKGVGNAANGVKTKASDIAAYIRESVAYAGYVVSDQFKKENQFVGKVRAWLAYAGTSFGEIVLDNEPTKISNVKATQISPTVATITWTTNHLSTSKVNFGTTLDYGQDVQSAEKVHNHTVTIENLTPNTKYFYEVMSQNKTYVYDAHHEFTTEEK